MKAIKLAIKLFIFLILLTSQNVFSQGLEIFDIDTTNYPTIKAKFYAYDKDGKIQRPTKDQLKIFENGTERQILEVSCPQEEPKSLSIAVMVDTYRYIDLARRGTEKLVDMLNLSQDQIGITYMDGRALIYQDFTNDRDKAIEKSKTIPNAPGVQVDKMFNTPYTGGIPFIKEKATQSKILVLVSDLHCPNLSLDEEKLIKESNENNIQIFTILLGTTDYSGLFKRLADNTNGKVFENVTNEEQISNDFNRIVKPINFEPCDITWESGVTCYSNLVNLETEFENQKTKLNYYQSLNSIANLKVSPNFISFGEVEPGKFKDTIITLTAINTDIVINDIKLKYGSSIFEVLNARFPINISQNTSKEITIRCTPLDSNMNYTLFEIQTNSCPFYISVNSGFPAWKIKNQTLKILSPNGGEYFIAGKDSIITWEGISPTDTCKLEFSSDNGLNWKTLTNEANNLKYEWKGIPNIKSDSCLIKISQNIHDKKFNDSLLTFNWFKKMTGIEFDAANQMIKTKDGCSVLVGFTNSGEGDIKTKNGLYDIFCFKIDKYKNIIWSKTFGGKKKDAAFQIIQLNDGNLIIAGNTQSTNGDFYKNNGYIDIFIMKLNNINGDLIWTKTYGGSEEDRLLTLFKTFDNNFCVTAAVFSKNFDFSDNQENLSSSYSHNIFLIEFDENGDIIKKIIFNEIQYTKKDISYLPRKSFLTKNNQYVHLLKVQGYKTIYETDLLVIVTDINHKILWHKVYGGSKNEDIGDIIESKYGGYYLIGSSNSIDNETKSYYGDYDGILYKLDNMGNIQWSKNIGGSNNDFLCFVEELDENNLIVGGLTNSIDNIFNFNFQSNTLNLFASYINLNKEFIQIKEMKLLDTNIGFNNLSDQEFELQFNQPKYIINNMDNNNYLIYYNYNDYEINNPNKTKYYEINFYSLNLLTTPLQTDISDNVFSIIVPEPVFEKLDIEMGAEVVGFGKDTMVTCVLSNKGEAPLHVLGVDITSGDVDDFMVPRGAGDFILEPNECRDMMFAFEPKKVGLRQAKITVRTTIGDYKDTISIKGIGVKPEFIVINDLINLGRSKVNQSKDSVQVAVIKNVSSEPIKITNIYQKGPNYVDFVNINDVKNATIQPNEDLKLDLRFKPTEKGRTSGTLFLEYDGLGSPLVVQLFGEGWEKTIANMSFSTTNLEEYQDAKIEFPVNLTSLSEFEYSEIESIDLDLTYDHNLLEPIDFTPIKINENVSKITISNLKFENINQPLNKVKFKVLEGSEASCDIKFSNPKVSGGDAKIVFKNGTFKRLNICDKSNNGIDNCKNIMRNVYPNPAEDKITIELNPKELGQTEISIYENTGKKLKTIFSENIKELGTRKITKLINDMPHGSYTLVFNSPNFTERTTIVIMK